MGKLSGYKRHWSQNDHKMFWVDKNRVVKVAENRYIIIIIVVVVGLRILM